jgi:uncharacterized protein YecE (DUF72 family)
MAKTTGGRVKNFLFHDLSQNILIGTASDRYAGWIGQIYSEGRYEKGITRRSHKVGDKTFPEETLPVESVSEYFEHFPLLEIDYTFYRLLVEKDRKPTQNFHALRSYRQHMKDGDRVLLKAPQIVIARKIRRGSSFVENENYLNPEIFTKQFYQPAIEILGPCLNGFIFEQEYHVKNDRFPPTKLAQDLDEFFSKLPSDTRYHIELRTEAYLVDPVFHVLKKHGVGLVFSHWTWLPPLRKQLTKVKAEFFNSGRQAVIRLITPLRMSYEESYAKAFPFDKMVPGMLDAGMIEDAARIVNEAMKTKVQVNFIINNRAGGNAPLIAQTIADKLHLLPVESAGRLDEGRGGDCPATRKAGQNILLNRSRFSKIWQECEVRLPLWPEI